MDPPVAMRWKRQGSAVTAGVSLIDGRQGTIVVVGSRSNARGAVLVTPRGNGDGVDKLAFSEGLPLLSPRHTIEILALQERLHGDCGLQPPGDLAQ